MIDRRGITWLDIAALFLGGAIVLSLVTTDVAGPLTTTKRAATVDAQHRKTIVRLTGQIPPGTEAEFEVWQSETGYYGAFAIGKNGGAGWVSRQNSEAFARATALAHCTRFDQDCLVVAVSLPVSPAPAGSHSLGLTAQEYFAEYVTHPGAAAFATAENGASGWAWNHATRASARAQALAYCSAYLRDRAAYLPPLTCRVIDERDRF